LDVTAAAVAAHITTTAVTCQVFFQRSSCEESILRVS
jgi:hypothetical protein